MKKEDELRILGYLKENPAAKGFDRHSWAKRPNAVQQYTTFLPLDREGEPRAEKPTGYADSVLIAITHYLESSILGLHRKAFNFSGFSLHPNEYAAHVTTNEADARPIPSLTKLQAQFFFTDADAQRVREYVEKRMAELNPTAPPPSPFSVTEVSSERKSLDRPR